MHINYRAAMLGLVAALTACPQTPAPDTTAPTILSSAPASAATDVALSANLSIRFSENMDKTSLQVAATPTTNLGAPVWSDSSTVVYTPPAGWQLGTGYAVSVTGRDVAGNALKATTISFQTVAATDTTPPATPSGITATAGDSAFTLAWATNTEADLNGYTVYWGDTANTLVNASFVAKPTTTATIPNLENAKAYFYAVDAEDSSGNRSAKSAAVSVTPSDASPPTLVSSEPAGGASDIALVPSLSFTFSEAINTASLEIGFCVSTDPPATAACVAPSLGSYGAATWSDGDSRVQFTPPSGSFKFGSTYVLVLNGTDKAGNALTANTKIAFATRATPDTTPPTVTAVLPLIDNTKEIATIKYTFSEAMTQTSVQNAFLSQPPLTCTWAWSGNSATCTVLSGLKQDTAYVLTIGTGASDTAGNRLASAYQSPVRTGNFPPRVTKFTPNPGAFGGFFAANTPITMTFSEPMNPASLTALGFLVNIGNREIAGSRTWSQTSAGPNTVLTFTPTTAYGDGVTVSWTLGQQITDLNGLAMTARLRGSFQTRLGTAP